jgi:hypothetical protein
MPRVVPSQIVDFIDQAFPQAKKQVSPDDKGFSLNRNNQFSCAALIDLLDQLASNLLVLESSQYTELVSSKAAIKEALQTWKLRDYGLDRIPGYDNFNPVSLIRRALSRCPDETPLKSAAIIPFIDDNELRASLEIDISAATVALSNGEWKAATVLGGSVIEALLLWILSKFEPEKINKTIDDLKKEKR